MSRRQERQDYVDRLVSALHYAFGEEWRALHWADAITVRRDYAAADLQENGLAATEYARRIGKGNLSSYVRTLADAAQPKH